MRANGGRRGRSRIRRWRADGGGVLQQSGRRRCWAGGGKQASVVRVIFGWARGSGAWGEDQASRSFSIFSQLPRASTVWGSLGSGFRSGRRDDANKGRSKQARARAHESGARADFLGNLKRQQRGVMPVDVCAAHKPEARAHFYFQQQQARPLVAATTGRRRRRLHLARGR